MAPSQLKRLKSSLREQGITGPQRSKKDKKNAAKHKTANDRVHRNVALQQIRESFNPFEFKASARPAKFEYTTNEPARKGLKYRDVLHRPGVSKGAGEEMRRATLLPEMQKRNKVGGMVDRRIGEGDVNMTPEERAAQRFARENAKKRGTLFDLEVSDEDEGREHFSLTHGGRRVEELPADDFEDRVDGHSEDGSDDAKEAELMAKKRLRNSDAQEGEAEDLDQPATKKTKKEVMEEVIAKSKLHKYERQKAKEDDEDLREELDKGMGDIMAILRAHKAPQKQPEANHVEGGPVMNPDRQRLLKGADRSTIDKDYEVRLRQLAQDAKAKPSERTKTEEEKLREEAERLKELEDRRVKRMRGDPLSDEEDEMAGGKVGVNAVDGEDGPDEAAEFGFVSSLHAPRNEEIAVLPDEDEFELDENLIASDSEANLSEGSASDGGSDMEEHPSNEENEEDEFVTDILGDGGLESASNKTLDGVPRENAGLSFTFPCPRSHQELLDVFKDASPDHIPTIIRRIRALYHPSLNTSNKELMVDFSTALVDHLAYMGTHKQSLHLAEQVMRHLHSLSRTYPNDIAAAFRRHLQATHERKDLNGGDLVLLTAIGSIYPTSDHFHQVATPAITLMARWLALKRPDSPQKHNTGALIVALCLQYQRHSKRYIPEAVTFTHHALTSGPGASPDHRASHLANVQTMMTLWSTKPSFPEIFSSFLQPLQTLAAHTQHRNLEIAIRQAILARRPLELHHHRPLAIRASIPKFEEGFHPDKHYDPDAARREAQRLKQEYRREKKGAVRELRKDASFVARETLREKREKDAEYERKYRRLVAEVQGEEGREAKEYGREKERRKRGGR